MKTVVKIKHIGHFTYNTVAQKVFRQVVFNKNKDALK